MLERLKERAFLAWLGLQTRPGVIHRVVRDELERVRRGESAADLVVARGSVGRPLAAGRHLRVAAVQMELTPHGRVEGWVRHVTRLAGRASLEGAEIVTFPEDAATHLLGLLPNFAELSAGGVDAAVENLGEDVQVADLFRFLGEVMARAHRETFAELARLTGSYLHGGSVVLPGSDGQVYNEAYLFGPDGTVVGRQAKTHLLPMEAGWGLTPGGELGVLDVKDVRIGLPICMDATYYEPFRILAGLGAELILLPIANSEPYYFWRALRGIWPRVQESQVYGVKSAMVGHFAGIELTGRSGIFAPLELTPEQDGVVAELAEPDQEGIVVADLDFDALARHRREHPVAAGFNLALYERYFPAVYGKVAKR